MSEQDKLKLNHAIIKSVPCGKYINIRAIREELYENKKWDNITYNELVNLFSKFSKS